MIIIIIKINYSNLIAFDSSMSMQTTKATATKMRQKKDAYCRIMAQKVRFKTLCISKPSSAKQQREITKCAWTEKGNPDGNCLSFHLELNAAHGKISAQLHTIVKQVCFPNGNVLFLSLFSLSKN